MREGKFKKVIFTRIKKSECFNYLSRSLYSLFNHIITLIYAKRKKTKQNQKKIEMKTNI